MIRLQLHEFLILYAGLTLGFIFLAAWIHNLIRTSRDRRARRNILQCQICAHEFRDETKTILPRCPQCQARVERRSLSRL